MTATIDPKATAGRGARWTAALALLLAQAPAAHAQDALRIDELRQDVAELRRELAAQARRIDELERHLAAARTAPSRDGGRGARADANATPAPWLEAARWDRLRAGMAEPDVVALLGPPTSTRRADDGALTLLYALELSGSGYLGGRVVLRSGRVAEVVRPQLR